MGEERQVRTRGDIELRPEPIFQNMEVVLAGSRV